jgi:branched-chain amino acid transport system ATP-binding protein
MRPTDRNDGAGTPPQRDTEPLLVMEGVAKRFSRPVLTSVDITIASEGVHVLLGGNGSGKTTLFNVASGFIRPDAGRIRFDGRDIVGLSAHRVARMGMGHLFQDVRIFPTLTLLENVTVGGHSLGEVPGASLFRWRAARASERRLRQRALELLDYVGLSLPNRRHGNDLSHGQKKRLAIARLLMTNPKLVLLDEPSAGLDPAAVEGLVSLVHQLAADGRSLWIIEHNREVVRQLRGTVAFLTAGSIIAEGPAGAILADEHLADLYLASS